MLSLATVTESGRASSHSSQHHIHTCVTGEKLVGPCNTLFMDEISTGLDSSTTYLIVKCMRNFVHMAQGTVLMALLQPAPEVYELFDDIMLLCEGTANLSVLRRYMVSSIHIIFHNHSPPLLCLFPLPPTPIAWTLL